MPQWVDFACAVACGTPPLCARCIVTTLSERQCVRYSHDKQQCVQELQRDAVSHRWVGWWLAVTHGWLVLPRWYLADVKFSWSFRCPSSLAVNVNVAQ